MRPRPLGAPDDAVAIFDQAVRDRAIAVVTVQANQDWLCFKCRFLERDPQQRFFVLDYLPASDYTPPELIPGQCVGVSFRHKSRKLLFATSVEAKGHFRVDDSSRVAAVRYRWPERITELQRRAYLRTIVPDHMNLPVQLWLGGSAAREGQTPIPGHLLDISCGGALVALGRATIPAWPENATLGAQIRLPDGDEPICLDAHARGIRVDERHQPTIAIQFVGLELDVDGRLTLQRLARAVQKLERIAGSPASSRSL